VLDRVRAHVEGLRALEGARLLALFATPDGFWQEYHLPVALPSLCTWSRTPISGP